MSETSAGLVSVIIPTTCESSRIGALRRAIDSALNQTGTRVEVLIMVNGNRVDAENCESLRRRSELQVHQSPEGSAQKACRRGRSLATGEFIAFLDDDDEFLPGALALRSGVLMDDARIDLVVTNGYRGPDEQRNLTAAAKINEDPLLALFSQNWLASCGGLFRKSSCEDEFFADLPRYNEWTVLACRLILGGKRMRFIDTPTYRIHDTPGSASKSAEFRLASVGIIEHLLTLPVPSRIRRLLRRRLLAARHELSVISLESGDSATAWKMHLRSLSGVYGLRYLPYSRHFLHRLRHSR